jgi:hypothetical protein
MNFEFNRILGGIGWAGNNKPGSGVVVGEDAFPEIGGRIYHCHLLAETEDNDTGQLLRKCAEMKARFKAGEFYGRYDEANMNFLTFWNRDARDRRLPEFHIYPAPASEDGKIGYHLNLLRDRLRSGRKTLHFSKQSKLPGYLRELPTNGAATLTDSQYPAVAALAYVVSVLTIFEPDFDEYEESIPRNRTDSITGY